MLNKRIENITSIVNQFTGRDGEPGDQKEIYILKSMWVMMLSEFEGSIKDLVESYIDRVKKLNIEQIHICLLLQHFHSQSGENITINNVMSVYKRNPNDISYLNFTREKKPKYKSHSVQKLFNSLGIFFSSEENTSLKKLDGIASTRDSIAHGDNNVEITKKELEQELLVIENIFSMLESKLEESLENAVSPRFRSPWLATEEINSYKS